jgi:hypothetical protein
VKGFAECFSELPDPRADNALHDLTEILFIALMATLCGATACTDMALFARMKAYLWQDVLVLENGCQATTPSVASSACSIRRPSRAHFGVL